MLATRSDQPRSALTNDGSRRPAVIRHAVDPVCAKGDVLLVEASTGSRTLLQRQLRVQGFAVTSVVNAEQAEAETAVQSFGYAVVGLSLRDKRGLDLIRQLRGRQTALRIVVVTDVDSFATVVLALRAGADAFLPMPFADGDLVDALLDRASPLPPVPETPLGPHRTCWEHIIRIHEQCGRNVSLTAQRLRMHRRSLQRMLGKRAPQPRAAVKARAEPDAPISRFRRQPAGSRIRPE